MSQVVFGSDLVKCVTDREWFGPFKESLNLSSGFTSISELLSRIIRTFSDFVPSISVSSTDNYVTEDGKSMVLAVEVFSQPHLSEEAKNKIFIGQFLHEMSHLRYTFPESKDIRFKSNSVKMKLFNILEDKRIEQKASFEFPGFNKFLQATRTYYTTLGLLNAKAGTKVITSYNSAVMSYISTRTLFTKTYEFPDFRLSPFYKSLMGSLSKETIDKINELVDPCFLEMSVHEMCDIVDELYKLLEEEELKQQLSKDSKSMSGGDPSEEGTSLSSMGMFSNGDLKDKTFNKERKKVESLIAKANEIISSDEDSTKLSSSYTSEGLPSSAVFAAQSEFRGVPKVEVIQADYKPLTSSSYKSYASAFKVKIKTLGAFLDRERQYFEQSEGEIDEDEVSRIRVSKDIFTESDFKQELGLEIITLLDLSGSMSGQNIENQRNLSIALADAFSKARGITSKFYGHTTKCVSYDKFENLLIIDFNGKDKLEKLNSQVAKNNNLDGFAIDFVATKFDRRSKSKILIVVSDGAPSAASYGGTQAEAHVKSRVEQLSRQGIQVLSVSLESRYNEAQKRMYTHIVPFSSFKQTMQDIAGWINKEFSRYSRSFNF